MGGCGLCVGGCNLWVWFVGGCGLWVGVTCGCGLWVGVPVGWYVCGLGVGFVCVCLWVGVPIIWVCMVCVSVGVCQMDCGYGGGWRERG